MGYKILLADNSVTVQKIITLTFFDEGVDVLTVNNGHEAIRRLQHMRPALVMADVSISGKNGYEICEFIKTHPEMKNTPVILLVPAFEIFDEERAQRIGADYHLTKPFQSIRTLITTVKNLIEQKDTSKLTSQVEISDKPTSESSMLNGKSAKLEELIRQTVAVSDSGLSIEEELLLQIDLSQAENSQVESLAMVEIEDEFIPAEASQALITENLFASKFDQYFLTDTASAAHRWLNVDGDVLELDDGLPELRVSAKPQTASAETKPSQPSAPDEARAPSTNQPISQSVIDEIVNRVVAQALEKLSDNVASKLAEVVSSSDLPHRIASEVAEILANQQLLSYRATETLLEID